MRTKPLNAGRCEVHGDISGSENLAYDTKDGHHFCLTCVVAHTVELEWELESNTVRHLASELDLRHTIEQLEDKIERAKFHLTDPTRVEDVATVLLDNFGDLGDFCWEELDEEIREEWREQARDVLAAADDVNGET